jgi:hypothetical protein
MKVGTRLYPSGTEVRMANSDEIKSHWPGIKANPRSSQIAVMFPGRIVPTIVSTTQLAEFHKIGQNL